MLTALQETTCARNSASAKFRTRPLLQQSVLVPSAKCRRADETFVIIHNCSFDPNVDELLLARLRWIWAILRFSSSLPWARIDTERTRRTPTLRLPPVQGLCKSFTLSFGLWARGHSNMLRAFTHDYRSADGLCGSPQACQLLLSQCGL